MSLEEYLVLFPELLQPLQSAQDPGFRKLMNDSGDSLHHAICHHRRSSRVL
jgi:hypothetical protein